MEMKEVDSSDLLAVGYDADSSTLIVRFKRGNEYEYRDVEPNIYNELLNAASVGKYFNQYIKNNYSYSKISS